MKLLAAAPGFRYRLLLIGILWLASALRLVAIDQIPAGFSHDEAYNGVAAIQTLEGDWRIFYEINKGIEPLIIYLEAGAFHWLGVGPVQMRLVNVFFGLLTVVLVYPLAARLFNREVALLAMAGLAISFWAVFTSRLSLRATLFPPLLLITLYLFWRGLDPIDPNSRRGSLSSLTFLILSGVTAGLTMYTYLTSRFLPLLLLIIAIYYLLRGRLTWQHGLGLLLHLLIWASIFAPLLNYYLAHAESFSRRADQVSTLPYALNGDFSPILKHTGRTLGMFTFSGDSTDRYNLDGRPIFDWGNGLLFYLGLGIVIWQALRSRLKAAPAIILLITLLFMLLPGFITDDSPHFLRTIGAMPVVYILWGLGLATVGRWISQREGKRLATRRYTEGFFTSRWAQLFIILVLLLTGFRTSFDYFQRWATAQEARHIYGADIAEIAHYLKMTPDDDLAVISAEYYRDLDPFRFALHFQGHPPFVIWFDGTQSLAFPPQDNPVPLRYLFPDSAPPADLWTNLLRFIPEESGSGYQLYRLPLESPLAQLQALEPLNVTVNDDLILLGYQILDEISSGGQTRIVLAWQALRALPPGTDYTFLVQLWDRQQHLWLEVDGNGYDADDWQPGVQGLQLLTLRLPGDLPPQSYDLTVDVVNRQTRQALPASSGGTTIPLTTVKAQLAPKPREVDPDRLPNPMEVKALGPGYDLALRGYQLSQRTVQVGDGLSLTLHWQVLEQPQEAYKLLFFLEDPANNRVYEWPLLDPIHGEWPTDQWPAQYWVQDKLKLSVGPEVPPGSFRLRAAWLNPGEQRAVEGSLSESFELGTVLIAPKE